MTLQELDAKIISFSQKISLPTARFSIFVLFFWFGFLKVVGLSSAAGVVENLFNQTIPFMQFSTFLVLFGLFECLIGVLFLIRGAERVVIPLLCLHLVTTCGPLVFLPQETWTAFLVPTLEGQYIIKNLAIIAVAIGIAAHVEPLSRRG